MLLSSCLHLGDGHGYRSILAERPDARVVEPRRVAVAGRLRAAMIDSLHRPSEVMNDLPKIHDAEAMALSGLRPLNPRIKRRARPRLRPSESVRAIGLAAPERLA